MNARPDKSEDRSASVFLSEVSKRVEQSKSLTVDRQQVLEEAVAAVGRLRNEGRQAHLLFVCTHNSRRSQFAQFWCQFALDYFAVRDVHSDSCGTEVTECNPRTVASLNRAGVTLQAQNEVPNPTYRAEIGNCTIELFSKAFGMPEVPAENVIAMLCCGDADEKCPTIPGAVARVPLLYTDPKHSDGTPSEDSTYDARSLEIGAEMFYLARKIGELKLA